MAELLRPYVPRLVIDWLRETPGTAHRQVQGSLAFADISGFTTLTERLARRGKVGAEEMGDLLNATFGQLLVPAYDYGAALIKWGGDAALLLFEDDDHAARACQAALEMQRTIRRVGRLRTSAGSVTLRMSVGVHSGTLDFFLVGNRHRELVVTGPAATTTTAMEAAANATEVLVSPGTAALIDPRCAGAARDGGVLLAAPPPTSMAPHRGTDALPLPDLERAVPAALLEHVSSGLVDSEHRQVTTGFVQFLGADALLTREGPDALADALTEVIDAATEAAERHGVTFLTSDIGADGGKLILVSGAPRNHDRSEERMLCALRNVLDTPTRLPLRAGATTGRVFTGDFGPRYRRTYSVVGDTVNLAARLMGKAAVGEIITTPEVVERSRTRFAVTELPPFPVKGKSNLISAVSVGEVVAAPEEPTASVLPFVGRDSEVVALLAALHAAQARSGRLVELVGEAGIGKSRLIEELRRAAFDVRQYSVVCDVYEAQTPYAPWRRLLTDLLAVRDVPADVVAETLRATVDARCRPLLPWLPLLASVLGVEAESTPEVAALDDKFRRARLASAVGELLTALLDTTSVIVFDDVHLMDDPSCELLHAVSAILPERPWLVAVTRRPNGGGFEAPALDHVVPLWLTPLDENAATELLEAATEDDPLRPHEVSALRARAGGNPLFLRELLAASRTVDTVEDLPDSLEAVVSADIDRLPAPSRRLLLAASVLGMSVDRSLLLTLLAGDEWPVTDDDWAPLGKFLAGGQAGRLRFRHNMVRDTAYALLPFRRRSTLHGRAGDELAHAASTDPDQLAMLSFHFHAAQRHDESAHFSRLAGDRARTHYANVEAALFYGRALASGEQAGLAEPALREIAELLGQAWFHLGEFAKAEAAYAVARRLARGDALVLANIELLTAKIRIRAGRYPQALSWLSRALRSLTGETATEARTMEGRLSIWQAYVRNQQGRQREAITWARRAIELAEAAGARDVLAGAYHQLDLASIAMGNFDHEADVRRALAIWEELGDLSWQAVTSNHLGLRTYFQGDWPESLRWYERSRQLFERIGDQWNAAVVSYNIAEIYTDQRRFADADAIIRRSLRIFRASGTKSMVASTHALLGRVAVGSGRYDEGRTTLEEARDELLVEGVQSEVMEVEARVIECLLLEGRHRKALARAEQALDGLRADCQSVAPLLHRVRGLALAEQRRRRAAVDALHESLLAARRLDARNEVALTLDALVELQRRLEAEVDAALVRERDALIHRLGIVTQPAAIPDDLAAVRQAGPATQAEPEPV